MSINSEKSPTEPQNEPVNESENITNNTDEQSTNSELNLAQARIQALEAELKIAKQSETEALLRARAEVENMRRRCDQEIEKAHKFALEKFANNLLPVIDNLERGIELADKENPELKPMLEGMELTLKSLLDTISKFGITVLAEINVPFNPEIHEAMTLLESDQHAPNHVMFVMQKGYNLNGRLLRPARVAVSKSE